MPKTFTLRVRIADEQRAAIERIADERGEPLAALVAGLIATETGVADPLLRHRRRRRES